MRDPDPHSVFEVRLSPVRPAVAGAICAALAVLTAVPLYWLLRASGFGRSELFLIAILTMWVALAWLGLGRALQGRRVAIVLSPDGFRDMRGPDITIPWPDIRSISAWRGRHGHIRLVLSPSMTDAVLGRPGLLRRLKSLNWFSTAPILPVPTTDLEIGTRRLHDIMKRFATAHGGPQ